MCTTVPAAVPSAVTSPLHCGAVLYWKYAIQLLANCSTHPKWFEMFHELQLCHARLSYPKAPALHFQTLLAGYAQPSANLAAITSQGSAACQTGDDGGEPSSKPW
ncbi:unnamed protein product [Polarella glacialis]|uniref:Uncharacterized protein n=1 Tax=Polarella glacialis TaxID=89957 RepID=A0A813E2C1_POLGL|nr:unnamed protein product [Polarella glacialis]